MKLVPNAVFAVKANNETNYSIFLYVNSFGNISPFWIDGYEDGDYMSKHGELSPFCPMPPRCNGHNHWYCVDRDGSDIKMIQSHVTKPSDIDFKLAHKISWGAK